MWPIAFFSMFRTQDATRWSRLHARQATVFGITATSGFFILLALPFAVAIGMGGTLGTGGTITLYAVALALDAIVACVLSMFAIRWSLRAARGDLFTIPVVTRASDRLFSRNGEERERR